MPINVNNGPTQAPETTPEVNNPSVEGSIITEPSVTEPAPIGLSETELNDPNSIRVTVSDPNTPIVILYGPPSCGKTMTLVRMTRYLLSQGYTVVPEKTFRPTFDENYKQLCETFDQMINSNSAATSTANISFMLVKVLRKGKPVCQLLEAPGEYYFKPDEPNRPYPAYVHEILNSTNRKVWAIMVEPDWSDSVPRADYVTRIRNLKSMMASRDKVIFVYNKRFTTLLLSPVYLCRPIIMLTSSGKYSSVLSRTLTGTRPSKSRRFVLFTLLVTGLIHNFSARIFTMLLPSCLVDLTTSLIR